MAVFAKHVSLSTSATAVSLSGTFNKVLVTNKDTTAANVVSVAFGGATAVSLADDTVCVPIGVTKTIDVAQYGLGNQTFTVTASGNGSPVATGNGVTILVSALAFPLQFGAILTWTNGGVLTLNAPAAAGATSITGNLVTHTVADAETATATSNVPNTGIKLSLIAAAGTPAVDIEATN